MKGYFDVHAHILPGLDDGSRDMDMTRELLRLAYEEGVRNIIATPHFIPGKTGYGEGELERLVEEVNAEAEKMFDDPMKVYIGNELYGYEGLTKELKEGQAHTLAGTSYVLVEFDFEEKYQIIYNRLKKLIGQGYRPILAHMERYGNVMEDEDNIWELVGMGAYIQVNIDSLYGGIFDFEAKNCRRLLEEGAIHFLGSDCHDSVNRKPRWQSNIRFLLKKKVEKETLERVLIHNPQRLLKNEYL